MTTFYLTAAAIMAAALTITAVAAYLERELDSFGDIGPIDTHDVLDDLIDGDTWATQQYLAGNLPGYERLLDAVDDPFYETRLEIAALPDTRTR